MRRTIGFLMFIVGLAGAGWLGFEFWRNQSGEFPTVPMLIAVVVFLLGAILLFAGRRRQVESMDPTMPPRP